MTTTTDAARAYVETHPHLVAYWDQYGRPVGYTSHQSDIDAETTATNQLGRILNRTGATVALARFYELNTTTNNYDATGAEMEH